ncbi:MAG: hypothetical protein KBS81_05230, partial [Spirochaetales bacterium]|nr:hypothetical protein [Candidatus Physcosoma equi]
MLTIRRKYKSFTVIQNKERFTARRKEDNFLIMVGEKSVSLTLGPEERILIQGSATGYAKLLTPTSLAYDATMIFEILIDGKRYLLT